MRQPPPNEWPPGRRGEQKPPPYFRDRSAAVVGTLFLKEIN